MGDSKKKKTRGVEDMGFPEVYIKEIACGISIQVLIKNEVEFPG